MEQVKVNTLSTIPLGRQGENLARQILFDVSGWEAEYGLGVVELIAQRPGEAQPYPVAVHRNGTIVTWDVSSTDTEMPGDSGKCELRYYVGEVLAKSKTWQTWVETAMDTPSETAPPEPEQGWVDQIIAVGAAAKASANAAKADADRAAALAAEVAEKAAQTAQDASDAAKAMEAAQTAQRLAEEAQGAAETARTAAETAQAAAEQSATDAAGAKQDAETAQKAAQDAAAAAAKALADIRALYQEMQTWAQGVIQDVNAAGSAAVQSVQSAGDTQVQRVTDEGATQTANAKAQADAAAQSAAGAAQSAQQAEESAAVYGDVVADVNQLKQDISAEQTAREEAENALRADLIANANADAVTKRSLDALWKLNQGISYQFETDDTEAYLKTVPSGAKLASVEAVGGKTVVWNQLVRKTTSTSAAGVTISVTPERSMVTLTGKTEAADFGVFNTNVKERINAIPGHWYYSSFSGSACEKSRYIASTSYSIRNGSTTYQPQIKQYTGSETLSSYIQLYAEIGTVFENDDLIGVVVDLTQLFGSGNEPTTTDDPRIAWIEKYAAEHPKYNARGLVSADVESVKHHDVVTEIPEEVRNLYGYGWSAGDVYNSIERTDTGWQYVQRVGSREYQEGDTVTDGVTTYYALDAPVITDITDLMDGILDAITVESGGTITIENAAKLPTPNTVEYAVKLSEVSQ